MRLAPVLAAFDRRLNLAGPPLAVGFSGGGDSLALLILATDWARAHARPVLSLTVDHRLSPDSAAWTAQALATARALGAQAQALAWEGEKPAAGLPAAARAARHALLAAAARAAGARVLLLGHTADDLAEAAAMRAAGSTVSDPRDWAPSPAWPEGRDVFLLRPLLALGRAELRAWLTARGETWLEDPANDDPRFARARARKALHDPPPSRGQGAGGGGGGAVLAKTAPTSPPQPLPARGRGYVVLPRHAPAAHLAAACLCAAGTAQPPRGERLARLVSRLRSGEAFTATLSGARIEAVGGEARVFREPGETARGGLAPLALPVDAAVIWDGRYELTAAVPGLTVRALKGLAARLPATQRQALKGFPVAARPVLPALVDLAEAVSCPILAVDPRVEIRSLIEARFIAATSGIDREPAT